MVTPSDEDLLTVEVVPRIANFLHLVLWGIVLCTSITRPGRTWAWTKMLHKHGGCSRLKRATSLRAPKLADGIIATNAEPPEVTLLRSLGSNLGLDRRGRPR